MFQNRRSSQKPDDELYAAFKESFPGVGPGSSTNSAQQGSAIRSASLSEALLDAPITSHRYEPPSFVHVDSFIHYHVPSCHQVNMRPSYEPVDRDEDDVLTMDYFDRPYGEEGGKEHEDTSKGMSDGWRLTPSLMDPNSYAFNALFNAPPGYYTPTPGGINTLYHSQAGDLHTPGMGMNTPMSLPHSIHSLPAHDAPLDLHHFQPHMLHQQPQFHHPFAQQQPTYAPPHHFLQQHDSGYVAMEGSSHKTTPTSNDNMMGPPSNSIQRQIDAFMGLPPPLPSGERFRFHTTLNAPTAMVRHAEEIPVTYLNKGQAYTLSIFDTSRPPPQPPASAPLRYRTFVRVSFEDEQQRAKPGGCWQLWKEGRGTAEAHQRAGKLLAVEYVDPNQGGDDETRKSHIELEKASFDGFSVTWTPNIHVGAPDCAISVRFNFLSIHRFQAIPKVSRAYQYDYVPKQNCLPLLTPTHQRSPQRFATAGSSSSEIMEPNGKLSNDVAHVKKTIDKLKQQISQSESGMGNMGKRKRSGSIAKASSSRPGAKVMKHKRTWSMDSEGRSIRTSICRRGSPHEAGWYARYVFLNQTCQHTFSQGSSRR